MFIPMFANIRFNFVTGGSVSITYAFINLWVLKRPNNFAKLYNVINENEYLATTTTSYSATHLQKSEWKKKFIKFNSIQVCRL